MAWDKGEIKILTGYLPLKNQNTGAEEKKAGHKHFQKHSEVSELALVLVDNHSSTVS